MSHSIPNSLVNKLNHLSDAKVRQDALHIITESLKNNILFKNIPKQDQKRAGDEINFVNFGLLVKNLIRWFAFAPIENEEKVLDLLLLILKVNFTE